MKAIYKPMRGNTGGFALMITLCFVSVSLILLASVMYWASTNGKISQQNITFTKSEAAAEAATEQIFTMMNRDFLYSVLNSSSYYATNLPNTTGWDVQYTFSDPTNAVSGQTYVYESPTNIFEPLSSQFYGLYGDVYDCYIASTATPNSALYTTPATVSQYLQAAVIPVFQFAVFYNLNMEINPEPPMVITGPVFCNAGIWATCSQSLNFKSTVQAVGKINLTSTDPFATGYTTSGGTVTFSLGGQPTAGCNPFTLPIAGAATTNTNPTNIEAILNLPPPGYGAPNAAAYVATNQIYLFNECDLIISNSANGVISNWISGSPIATGTNITIWYQDNSLSSALHKLTNNEVVTLRNTSGTNINNYASSNILSSFFPFVTNAIFYDYRETDIGQAIQIDVAKLTQWLTNSSYEGSRWNNQCIADKGHPIDSIYIYNNIPLSSTNLPCVRLVNGSQMPTSYGLTIATPMPAYIYGNYNVSNNLGNDLNTNRTTHTYPAAVLADAITILSGSWNDTTYTSSYSLNSRTPSATTVNAACLEGIVESNPKVSGTYSGGVENFLRMLENWNNSVPLYYNGSIVVMFPSIYATNYWQSPGVYYQPPVRNWAFDNNFKQSTLLPPLSPSSRALIRGQWTAY